MTTIGPCGIPSSRKRAIVIKTREDAVIADSGPALVDAFGDGQHGVEGVLRRKRHRTASSRGSSELQLRLYASMSVPGRHAWRIFSVSRRRSPSLFIARDPRTGRRPLRPEF